VRVLCIFIFLCFWFVAVPLVRHSGFHQSCRFVFCENPGPDIIALDLTPLHFVNGFEPELCVFVFAFGSFQKVMILSVAIAEKHIQKR